MCVTMGPWNLCFIFIDEFIQNESESEKPKVRLKDWDSLDWVITFIIYVCMYVWMNDS